LNIFSANLTLLFLTEENHAFIESNQSLQQKKRKEKKRKEKKETKGTTGNTSNQV